MEGIPSFLPTLLNADFCFSKGKNPEFLKFVCIDCPTQAITEIDKKRNHKYHTVLEAFICTKDYAYHTKDLCNLGLDVSEIAQYKFNEKYHIYPNPRPRKASEKQHKDDSKCCLTCGHVFTAKPHKFDPFCNFCCILCKYLYKGTGNPRRLAALESFLRNGSSSTRAVVYNDRGITKAEIMSKKAEESLKKSRLMMKKNQVLVEKSISPIKRTMMDEEKKNKKGKKRKESLLSEETKDKKLECLISELSVVVNKSYRKRPRKGIPHRAPLS